MGRTKRRDLAVRFHRVGALVVLLSLIVLIAPTAWGVTNRTRDEALNAPYLYGNLTWENGKGSIRWDAAPDGAPPGGAGHAEAGDLVDEFTVALDRPVFINASRLIQLDLLVTRAGSEQPSLCAARLLRVAVLIDGRLLAGDAQTLGGSGIQGFEGRNQAPPGYQYAPFRLPAEIVHLKAGSNFTIRITQPEGNEFCQFGVSSEAPSALRIPIFSTEEAVYRMPEIVPRVRGSAADGDDLRGLLGALSGFAIPSIWLRRRVHSAALLVLVFAAVPFAGCLGGRSGAPGGGSDSVPPDSGSALVTTRDAGGTGLAGNATAAILGQVGDPYGFPIEGAHVALLGTPAYARTSRNGLFSFRELTPDRYSLRVDANQYTSLQVEVTATANRITTVDITLAYALGVGEDNRPHRHDYWSGTNETLLYKGPVQYCTEVVPGCDYPFESFFIRPDAEPDHNIVRPGTSELEVVLEFEASQACASTLGFGIQDNVDPSPSNWSRYAPRPSGVPFHIQATWEMTDVGHQRFSTWTFGISTYDAQAAPSCEREACTGPCIGSFPTPVVAQVTITLKRGSIPLEPPHPDHWHGEQEVSLGSGIPWRDHRAYETGAVGLAIELAFGGGCMASRAPFISSVYFNLHADRMYPVLGGPVSIVPTETSELRVWINQSRSNGPVGTDLRTWTWALWYKAGDSQVQAFAGKKAPYREAPAPTVSADGREWHWTIPVKDSEADGTYNRKTAWRFVLVPSDPEARCIDAWSAGRDYLRGTMDVVGVRAPPTP